MYQVLLQIQINASDFKFGILAFVTAFTVAMIVMPPLIKIINRFKLFDVPDNRKAHTMPIPTMGGIATCAGMGVGCAMWFGFTKDIFIISLFFSMGILFLVGIMDDLRNMPARYKLVIQAAVATLIAFSGMRITSFNGLFGLHELPVAAQYTLTILAITGITNAFNLIDGIDGLAGGIGFMSLIILALFLTFSGDANTAVISFSLAGGLLGFLYYNFNPARIFMGDTGSLVLGFVVSVLCVKLIQLNTVNATPALPHIPVFAFSIVAIPVFDTLRVFGLRIWSGKSPFTPGRDHIHHVLTNNGWSHQFTTRVICGLHAVVLALGYYIKGMPQVVGLSLVLLLLMVAVWTFQRLFPAVKGKIVFRAIHGRAA